MQYMASFTGVILVLIIISVIVGKKTKNSGIGFLVFMGLCLFPVTLAFTSKLVLEIFHPKLYEIIEPLGEDFKGFRGQDSRSFFELYQQYPDIIEYGDGYYVGDYDKKVKSGHLHELINKEEYEKYLPSPQYNYIFVRYYISDIEDKNCYYPNKTVIKSIEEYFNNPEKKFLLEPLSYLYLNHNKCVAVKPIYKEEVSPYSKGGKLEDKVLLNIPGLLKIELRKVIVAEKDKKILSWLGNIFIHYNFYGAHLDGRKPFFRVSSNTSFKELITKKGTNNDNTQSIK